MRRSIFQGRFVAICLVVGAAAIGCGGPRQQVALEPAEPASAPVDTRDDAPHGEHDTTVPTDVTQTVAAHVVQPGETLWRIAKRYGVELDVLAHHNGITDPTRIEIGQTIHLPPGTAEITPLVWTWPVQGREVLSRYGARRSGGRTHLGLDVRGRRGQPVFAARAGRVAFVGSMRGYGKTVILDHGEEWTSLYAHNTSILVDVGDAVEIGQPIARVGRTGNATTEHVHFEIRLRDRPIDPLPHLSGMAEVRP